MPEKLLNDQIIGQVKDVFGQLQEPVQILFFGRKKGCDYCEDTLQLAQEIVELSEKISLSIYDLDDHTDTARQYGVDKTPAIVIAGRDGDSIQDYGIRYSGIPSGHEFSSFIHSIILVSGRDSGLSAQAREFLANLTEPVHLQVFVTPTCPYCPQAVILAHQMALESPLVVGEMIEAMEFPDLADRYGVSGVPQTTINDGAGNAVGALPEANLITEIQQALHRS